MNGTLAALLLALLALPAPARAYEDQLTLGAGAGYALALVEGGPAHGATALDLSVSSGLDATWSLRARASYALHPAERALHVVLVSPELLYLIDVVEVVPYLGLGVSGVGRASGGAFRPAAGAHLVLGFDYLLSRAFALGLDLRPTLLFTDLDRHPLELLCTVNAQWFFDH
jgi:hypothetical protein